MAGPGEKSENRNTLHSIIGVKENLKVIERRRQKKNRAPEQESARLRHE